MRDLGNLRGVLLLTGGVAAMAVGLATRDPATTGIGVTLLVATPAAARATKDDGSGP